MRGRTINELPVAEFKGQTIDNCFFVPDYATNVLHKVPMPQVFEWIKEKAISGGLKIELKGDVLLLNTP